MKGYIAITICLCLCIPSTAQSKWTLEQCIDYAIEHNLDIKQQNLAVENADLQLNTSRNSRLPNLTAGVNQNFNFGRSPSMATGIYEPNTSSSTGISVGSSVTLFSGLRISNEIKSNELNLRATMEGLKKAEENLSLTVTSYYLEILFKREILQAMERQLSLTSRQQERTAALVEAGSVPKSNLYDIRAQLAGDESKVTTASNDLSQALLNLALLLNVDSPQQFDIVMPDLDNTAMEYEPAMLSPENIYKTAIGIKPHVREAEYRLQSSMKDIMVAKSAFWPSIGLGMSHNNGFNYIYDNEYNNLSVSSQLKNNRRESIGLSMSIPIFNRLQSRNQLRTARLGMQSREIELEGVKQALYKEIYQAYNSATSAKSQYLSKENALLAASEAYKYAEERYRAGKSSVYEFAEAQTKMTVSLSEKLQAKYDLLFRMKILDFYSGKEITLLQ